MDFHIGSGLVALTQIGNEAEDLHFFGGRYGILTEKTAPAWQFTLIDSVFEGQRDAAIREHEAGLTLIRDTFGNVPTAIEIDPHYCDELWAKDCRFESVSGPAVVISNEKSPLTEIGFENAVVKDVPTFALFRESGKRVSCKGAIYQVRNFNYGIIVPGEGVTGEIGMRYDAAPLSTLPAPLPPAIPSLPPTEFWTNVHSLGVRGDGTTDDTAAIRKAIDTHRVLYFPGGHYVVSDTLALEADTVLISLHPAGVGLEHDACFRPARTNLSYDATYFLPSHPRPRLGWPHVVARTAPGRRRRYTAADNSSCLSSREKIAPADGRKEGCRSRPDPVRSGLVG